MGKPLNKLSKEEWAQVRELAESGKTDQWLEDEFGVAKNTIRQKRWADAKRGDPWMTPKSLQLQAAKEALESHFRVMENSGKEGVEGAELGPVSPEHLTEIRESTPAKIASWASKLMLGSLALIKPPTNLVELNTLHNIFRKAAGLEQSGGVAIQVNGMHWGSSSPPEKPVVVVDV